MDKTTLAVYESAAPAFVQRWLAEEEPADVYALFRQFFRPGLTADIGSGSGRDAAWLTANGFPAIGYDLVGWPFGAGPRPLSAHRIQKGRAA